MEVTLAGRILYGCAEIAQYLFPDVDLYRAKQRVYRLVRETSPDRLPLFKLGGALCARSDELDAAITERGQRTRSAPREAA
jgi:hypothetical protein